MCCGSPAVTLPSHVAVMLIDPHGEPECLAAEAELVRAVKENDLAADEFTVATRNLVIAGYPVVSDPATAVALRLSIDPDDLTFDSPRANAGRRT